MRLKATLDARVNASLHFVKAIACGNGVLSLDFIAHSGSQLHKIHNPRLNPPAEFALKEGGVRFLSRNRRRVRGEIEMQ